MTFVASMGVWRFGVSTFRAVLGNTGNICFKRDVKAMSRRPVNPARRLMGNGGFPLAGAFPSKTRSSPLLSLTLIVLIAFTSVVFPCLLLAYMGQGAYLIKHPIKADRVFYNCVPDGLFWPVFVIATLAAVIASQAMISATFSVIKQSMALGCFPRLKIVHTSKTLIGQIYIPVINWFLMVMCLIVVATFRSTTGIANAYTLVT